MQIIEFIREVQDMQNRIYELEYENARLREIESQYWTLLNGNIAHNEKIFFGLLQVGAELIESRTKTA